MKYLFIVLVLFTACSPKVCDRAGRILQRYDVTGFRNVDGNMIYLNDQPFAKLQAITFSLDGNKLVREINVKLLNGVDLSKVPDLIKYIHTKHHKSEVEVEMFIE